MPDSVSRLTKPTTYSPQVISNTECNAEGLGAGKMWWHFCAEEIEQNPPDEFPCKCLSDDVSSHWKCDVEKSMIETELEKCYSVPSLKINPKKCTSDPLQCVIEIP